MDTDGFIFYVKTDDFKKILRSTMKQDIFQIMN